MLSILQRYKNINILQIYTYCILEMYENGSNENP